MLISQRIAQKPRILKTFGDSKMKTDNFLALLTQSVKFIVPHEFINSARKRSEIATRILGEDNEDGSARAKAYNKKSATYYEFLRTPYPVVFLENDTAGILIQQLSDHEWHFMRVATDSVIEDVLWLMPTIEHVRLRKVSDDRVITDSNTISNGWNPDEKMKRRMLDAGFCTYLEAAEVMLFLNTSNVRFHCVKPTKRELGKIPKVLHPRYEYHVLDIYRERKECSTLDDVDNFLHETRKTEQERRAHMVRGHFKKKKNGLFWWNPFLRCRKNLEITGFVDKDYQLNQQSHKFD